MEGWDQVQSGSVCRPTKMKTIKTKTLTQSFGRLQEKGLNEIVSAGLGREQKYEQERERETESQVVRMIQDGPHRDTGKKEIDLGTQVPRYTTQQKEKQVEEKLRMQERKRMKYLHSVMTKKERKKEEPIFLLHFSS